MWEYRVQGTDTIRAEIHGKELGLSHRSALTTRTITGTRSRWRTGIVAELGGVYGPYTGRWFASKSAGLRTDLEGAPQ